MAGVVQDPDDSVISIETTCTVMNIADMETQTDANTSGGTTLSADTDVDMSAGSPTNSNIAPPSSPRSPDENLPGNSRASSERGTPSKLKKEVGRQGDNHPDNASTCSSSSSSAPRGRLPNRPGIIWRKGEKVEAMDYMKNWYPAKIIDVEEEDETVLIHFEGWNQRYDEWVEMTSEKLRPKMRHSERKDKRKRLNHDYKIGEQVYARWTDCKMYPAKINSMMTDGSYEVVFYDGFKKAVQPINIRPMPAEAKQQKIEIVHVLPKDSRRRSLSSEGELRKVDKDSTMPASANLTASETGKVMSSRRSSHREKSDISKDGQKTESKQRAKSLDSEPVKQKKGASLQNREPRKRARDSDRKRSNSAPKQKKLIVAGSFFAKRDRSDSASGRSSSGGKEEPLPIHSGEKVENKSVPAPVTESHTSISVPSSPASSVSTTVTPPATPKQQTAPQKLEVVTPVAITERPVTPQVLSAKREKKQKKRTVSPSVSEASSASESQSESMETVVIRNRSKSTEKDKAVISVTPVTPGVPKKAFIIEQDHNHYKCMFDGCNKAFRKESLLEYHIKYYHTDDAKQITLPPPRKRRKTTSMCSTDSDVSTSSKQTTPIAVVKKRHVSESSAVLPQEIHENIQVDLDESEEKHTLKHQRTSSQDTMATEESLETEDELSKDEVVNCICLYNEENGLMIQCEVCLCWQHASCFDWTKETLPKKYICFVCSDPSGVRESCRYMHEQDWLKVGQITKFAFLPSSHLSDDKKCKTIQATHGLVSDVHNINMVLKGLKSEIKCSKNPNSTEYKLWKTNIDAEEEDFTPLEEEQEGPEEVKQEVSEVNMADTVTHDNDISPSGMDTIDSEQKSVSIGTISHENDEDSKKGIENVKLTEKEIISDDSVKCEDTEQKEKVSERDVLHSGDDTDIDVETMDRLPTGSTDQSVSKSEDTEKASSSNQTSSENLQETSLVKQEVKIEVPPSEESPLQVEMDTTVEQKVMTVQEDPFQFCERNLLEHIFKIQAQIDQRLDHIEEQVTALECAEPNVGNTQRQDILADLPALKKSLHMLQSDLVKVKRMAAYHR